MNSLPGSYQIEECSPGDISEFKKVFELSVGKTKPISYYEYNQTENHLGSPIRLKLVQDGRLLGSHTIRPLLLNVDGRRVKSGLTMDSFIHPQHRKKGLFTQLVTATSNKARDLGWQIILGFANKNSINIYKNNLGHAEPGRLNYITLEKYSCVRQSLSFDVAEHKLPESAEAILQQDKSNEGFRISVCKDLPYIERRYMNSPESSYLVLICEEEFFCILKIYGDELQIMDFFYTDSSYLPRLMSSCFEYANCKGKMLSLWLSNCHPLSNHIGDSGRHISQSPQHLHVATSEPSYSCVLGQLANWHYVMGDSDVF
jgi:GNAT superfamily N-acetyltransferase